MIRSGKEVGFFAIKKESEKQTVVRLQEFITNIKIPGYIFVLVHNILTISKVKVLTNL